VVVSAGQRSRVSIELCGELRLDVDGRRRERELPGRLGRILLGYLALNHHRAVTRDELVEALWPGGAPDDPSRTLSTLLSGLRRCVGAELVRGRSELRLVLPDGARLDVESAEAAVERSRAALASGEPGPAAAAAEAALDVLERGLLRGFDAPWLDTRRRELEDERLGALELLARAGLQGGDAGAHRAQWASRQIIALAPFREAGYALLMETQARLGNTAEALETYERLRRLMRDELGATPSPELRAVHQRLLERTVEAHPDRESGALPLPVQVERATSRRLVGRAEPMAILRRGLDAALAGERRVVLLAGEPGIGKTSMAAAIARLAHEQDAVVLYGRSDEDALTPYQPFVEMVGHCFTHGPVEQLAEELRPELEELARLVPAVRRWLPAAGAPSNVLPDVERYRLFEAVVAVLTTLARRGTPVLVCDDLQWADPPTLQLLRHIARAPAPGRLLLVGTYRDVEVTPESPLGELIADLRREQPLDLVALGGLGQRETERLTELGPGTALRLRELTGGNPLFLGEMLRVLSDAPDPERALDELVVPEGVSEVVMRRVARLGEPAREILTLAAVAGLTFRALLLERAAAAPLVSVVDVLDRAVAAGLLVATGEPDVLAFAHALIREALYGRLSDARRVRLHLRVAETLEGYRAELRPDVAELAHHFFQARHLGGVEPAIHYAREAADRAAESLAWEDEARQLERALDAERLREHSDAADRTELLLALGEALTRAGRAPAKTVFATAAALARGRAPEQLGRAAIGYGGRYYEAGVIDPKLIELLREALDSVRPEEGELRSRLVARLAEILHFAGDTEASLRLSEEAVALATRLGDDETLAAALAGRHVSLLHVAHVDERLETSERLLRLADAAGDPEREMQALQSRIFDLLMLGDIPAARQLHERLGALARELRQPLFEHFAVGWACTFAQMDGRLEEAERLAWESFEMRRALGTQDAEGVLSAQLFMIRRAQGRLAEVFPAVIDAVARHPALAAWRSGLPIAHLAAGDETEARAELDRLVDGLDAIPRDFFWLTAMTMLAEASGALHATGAAERLYGELAPYATRWMQLGYAASDGPVARSLGILAAARGDTVRATEHFEHALSLCTAAGTPAFEARARADLAALAAPR
jgi:DNA-binding SARP family transcriptional activator